MQYFKHMSNMRHDARVRKVLRKYRANGYAVYNMILEAITENITTESPLPILSEDVEDMAYTLGISESEIEEIVSFCSKWGLLQIISETGTVYCLKIYKYLNSSSTRSKKIRSLITSASGKTGEAELTYNDIKADIEAAILLECKALPDMSNLSETVCDNNDRRRTEQEEEQTNNRKRNYNPPYSVDTNNSTNNRVRGNVGFASYSEDAE